MASDRGRRVLTARGVSAGQLGQRDVTVVPSAAYHVAEAGPLAGALAQRGVRVVIATPQAFAPTVLPALSGHVKEVEILDPADRSLATSVLVVFDDWGNETAPLIAHAAAHGLHTIAKVEGAQDFDDIDVGRVRRPYRTASVVLGQGANDRAALADRDVRVVGSSRLERIWLGPPRAIGDKLAVINVNFTWGVLEEARDLWVQTAVAACERAGIPFVLSMHPVERDHCTGRYPIADDPMRHLLTRAGVLISRFSTVPFEAMARGVPFIYHNPHGEKVPTFQQPDGAFETSNDVSSLVDALAESRRWLANYRQRAADFFARQVDVDPNRTSEERAADVIVALLATSSGTSDMPG